MFEADPDWDSRHPPTVIVELVFRGGQPGDVAFDQEWAAGDLVAPPATIRHKDGGWKLTSDAPASAALEEHLRRILEKLAAIDLGAVKRPAAAIHLSVTVHCQEGNAPELWVPAPFVAALSGLGASLDFDVYDH